MSAIFVLGRAATREAKGASPRTAPALRQALKRRLPSMKCTYRASMTPENERARNASEHVAPTGPPAFFFCILFNAHPRGHIERGPEILESLCAPALVPLDFALQGLARARETGKHATIRVAKKANQECHIPELTRWRKVSGRAGQRPRHVRNVNLHSALAYTSTHVAPTGPPAFFFCILFNAHPRGPIERGARDS